jgi:hypothetical protein
MKHARNRQYSDTQCVAVSESYPQGQHHINYNKTLQYSGAFNYKKNITLFYKPVFILTSRD